MIGIVVSRADEASTHIGESLREVGTWTEREDGLRPDAEGGGAYYRHGPFELREFEALHLHLDGAAGAFTDPDLLVFVSRHAGETGPLLSTHFTGNVGPAEYGGGDGRLARAAPNATDRVLHALAEHAPEHYDVGMECTHHGPSRVGVPSMFVEIGSAEPQWRDPAAAEAVARVVLDIAGTPPDTERTVVGFGGGHYVPRFERIARETDWAVGHVAADWGLTAVADAGIDPERVIEAVFEESAATRAVIDGELPDIEARIDDLGYGVVSETWVRETTGVPLDLVARLEDALAPVDSGLRFGEPARRIDSGGSRSPEGNFERYALPPALLSDCHGIDPDRTREAVAGHALAFETEEAGNRVMGSLAVPARETFEDLVDALCPVLAERYESVERARDEIRVTERAFDPAKAKERGVPEGPAFGRLSNGQPVEVDGETVAPEDVHETRHESYRL